MKKYIVISVYLFSYLFSKSQVNLVLNPSFEDLDSACVSAFGNVKYAKYWHGLDNSINPESCQTKLFNTCSISPSSWNLPKQYNNLYQNARTGNSLVCFAVYGSLGASNIRGYIIGQLSNQLILGKTYCVTYYVNSFNNIEWFVNKCGCYFDDGTLFNNSMDKCMALNIIPHIDNTSGIMLNDTLGWMKIQGIYTANGTETRLTLGNFYNDVSTGHTLFNGSHGGGVLNIEDISVIPIDVIADAGADVSMCIGDSVHLGRTQEIGLECSWYKPTIALPFATTSDIWFKATQAGTFTFIQKMDNCFTSFDTVHITVVSNCSVLQPIKDIPNVFTPNGDGVNDVWSFNIGFGNEFKSLTIANRWG